MVELFINGVKLNRKKFEYIATGYEGIVYKYGDHALKLYIDEQLSEKECKNLINLYGLTNNILLPSNIIVNQDGKYVGCATKYFGPTEKKSNILTFSKEDLEKNYNGLLDDVEILSKNGIFMDDVTNNVAISNKKIYLPDFGMYEKNEESYETVYNHNKFLTERALEDLLMLSLDKDLSKLESVYDVMDGKEFTPTLIREMNDKETVKEYINRK